jgi:hypothetical protein
LGFGADVLGFAEAALLDARTAGGIGYFGNAQTVEQENFATDEIISAVIADGRLGTERLDNANANMADARIGQSDGDGSGAKLPVAHGRRLLGATAFGVEDEGVAARHGRNKVINLGGGRASAFAGDPKAALADGWPIRQIEFGEPRLTKLLFDFEAAARHVGLGECEAGRIAIFDGFVNANAALGVGAGFLRQVLFQLPGTRTEHQAFDATGGR